MPMVLHSENNAKEYALFALRSMVTLNAGVAVAYPTIAQLLLNKVSIDAVFLPILLSLTGAICGIVCAYLTYWNHSSEAHAEYTKMHNELIQVYESFDEKTFYRFQKPRDEAILKNSKAIKKFDGRRNVLFYLANIIGVVSLLLFVGSLLAFALKVSV